MKKLGMVVLLLVVALFVQPGFGQDQTKNARPKKLPVAEQVADKKFALNWAYLTLWPYSGGGMSQLKEDVGIYPYEGIGVVLEGRNLGRWRVYVKSVWIDSPAEKTGLRKGDRIFRVNGERVCVPAGFDDEEEADWCPHSAAAAIKKAPSPVGLVIQRGKRRLRVTVAKEKIGKEIVAFAASHWQEWDEQIKKNREALNLFYGKIKAAGDDPSKLDELLGEVDSVQHAILRPWLEVADFIETRQHD